MRRLAAHLADDRRAQELVEYALLVALVGLVGIGAWNLVQTRIHDAYVGHNGLGGYNGRTQDLWVPPPPASATP